ncbi:hypothetical protein J6590_041777 [Homalodisca vitripennis]|nr:hypothetical protein J6590_041777 [Homalodisca vitripennis]
MGSTGQKQNVLYHGYMLSWCNPVKDNNLILPILMCRGNQKYRTLIHSVLSERFDLNIRPFLLTQEEFMHLSTYCLVMLDKNDPYIATLTCKIHSGIIQLSVALEHLLKLWNTFICIAKKLAAPYMEEGKVPSPHSSAAMVSCYPSHRTKLGLPRETRLHNHNTRSSFITHQYIAKHYMNENQRLWGHVYLTNFQQTTDR